jgi:hypothetical protein
MALAAVLFESQLDQVSSLPQVAGCLLMARRK